MGVVLSPEEEKEKTVPNVDDLVNYLTSANPNPRKSGDPKPSDAYIANVRRVLNTKNEDLRWNDIVNAFENWGMVELSVLINKLTMIIDRAAFNGGYSPININYPVIAAFETDLPATTLLGVLKERYELLLEENLKPEDIGLVNFIKINMNYLIHAGAKLPQKFVGIDNFDTENKLKESLDKGLLNQGQYYKYMRDIQTVKLFGQDKKMLLKEVGQYQITEELDKPKEVKDPLHFEGFEFCPDPSKAYKHIAAATQLTQHLGHIVAGYYLEDKPVTEDKPKGADTAAAPAPAAAPTDTKWQDEVGRGNAAAAAVAKRDSSPKADGDRTRG